MEIITLREFARRIGVSLTAVQNGIKRGRIEAQTDASGKATGIDWDTQQEAWTANSKHPQKRPTNIAGGRPRNDGKAPAKPQTKGGTAPREGEVVDSLESQPHGGALKRSEKTPPPKGEMTLAEIQRARELVKLQLDNTKLKQAQGELVPAAEVEKQGRNLAGLVISALYNIPDRISDELAGMSDPHEIQKLLLQEFDRAVEELRKAYA